MRTVNAVCGRTIGIGRQGENFAVKVEFDVSSWVGAFGEGTLGAIYQRPSDTTAYPVDIKRDGSKAVWIVSALETERAGYGYIELQYAVGEAIVKSAAWATWVSESLNPGKTPPEPVPSWIDTILKSVNAAKESAVLSESWAVGGTGLRPGEDENNAKYWAEQAAKGGSGGGGIGYKIGHGLKVEDDTLSVNSVSNFYGDNTLPITAAAVQETVGNIEVLLGTI